jgi:glycosyltransferase involved in cell wall biosynthesis
LSVLESRNNRIKVLHIITRFICGGADENTLYTVNGLDKERYDVHLMIGNTHEDRMIARVSPSVKLIKNMNMVREISLAKDIAALMQIYRTIKREKYDILHTHTSKAGFLGRIASRMGRTPHIIHGVHTIPFADVLQPNYNGFYLSLEKFAGRFTDLFISVGDDLKLRYIKEGVGSPERYHTVYSGMDLELFDRALRMSQEEKIALRNEVGLSDGETCVGIVSRLEPGKGFNFFPDIVDEVVKRHNHVRFLVVGDGSLKDSLFEEISRRKLKDNVIFAGFREDVAKFIAIFDIAIFTSLLEGLPRTVVQYALLGKPIVTFDVGGINEVVKDGENGFIVPRHSIPDFVEKVTYLMENPHVIQDMRTMGDKFPRHQWSKDEMVRRIDELYQQVLNPHGGDKEGIKIAK